MYFIQLLQKMATEVVSSDEEDAKQKVIEDEISDLRSAMKELFEKARPTDKELERIKKRERECVDKLNRLRIEKHDRKKEKEAVKRLIELESELKRVKSENVKLKQSLDQATKHSKVQLQKIAELESRAAVASSSMKNVADQAQSESKDNSPVVKLQNQLHKTTKRMNKTKEDLNKTRRRLSIVQERLTVAEQVTELTPHQPTTHSGIFLTFSW